MATVASTEVAIVRMTKVSVEWYGSRSPAIWLCRHRYVVITPMQVGSAMASETVALLRCLMGCEG